MKNFIYSIIFCLLSLVLLSSCGGVEEETVLKEEQMIAQFIPNLSSIFEIEIKKVDVAGGINKAIIQEGDLMQPIRQGDSVYFYYVAYFMVSSNSIVLYDTNIERVAKAAGIDTEIRDFTPKGVIMTDGGFITGLNKGLRLCYQNSECFLIFNSDMGYGSKQVGIVPPYSPLVYYVYIERVKRN